MSLFSDLRFFGTWRDSSATAWEGPTSGRLAGADDRRAGVLVDAMRLHDLDVLEPGGGEGILWERSKSGTSRAQELVRQMALDGCAAA